jgi:hypothetical protein
MAVLTSGSGARRWLPVRLGLLAVAAYALLIAGCMVFEKLGGEKPEPIFSHARHAEEGLACRDCHFPDEGGGPPRMPAAAQCAICHTKLDGEKPPERQAAALFVDGEPRDTGTERLSSEIVFSHGHHTDYGLQCGTCHVGIETSTAVDPTQRLLMEDCQRCHAGAGVATACSTCHHEIRTDARPPNHTPAWERIHGTVVRGGSEGAANDCTLCHSEANCNECHQAVPPANHNNLWRLKSHGTVAGMDRQNCAVCHRTDFCERCHEETTPLSHKGGWGSPLNKHCVSCHFPLKSEGCSVCHRGTPSHQQAAPLPADHNPGMNCVQCHGLTAPLPHPDKGDSCIMCHN